MLKEIDHQIYQVIQIQIHPTKIKNQLLIMIRKIYKTNNIRRTLLNFYRVILIKCI